MKGEAVFFDTNILVYALTERGFDPRGEIAWNLLKETMLSKTGWLSTQVLQEFHVTVTRKAKPAFKTSESRKALDHLLKLNLVTIGETHIRSAVECEAKERISFWDALIVVAASTARCATLYTEDLNSGQTLCGVRVVNPFKE